MKNLKTNLFVVIILISFSSCNSDDEIEQNITEGYWVEKISKENFIKKINYELKSKIANAKDVKSFIENLPNSIDHYLIFKDDHFKEYITFRKEKLILIADIPASINENTLTLYHPDNSGKIISTLEILDGMILNHDVIQSMEFKKATFNENNVSAKWPFSYAECIGACVATHYALGISWANSICCFWY